MSKRKKRPDYQRPAGRRPVPASEEASPPPVGRSGRGLADWWPLMAAAGLTVVLVLVILIVNLDSPPTPARP